MPASNLIALDVGEKRVGVALARAGLKVPVALAALDRTSSRFWEDLRAVLDEHEAAEAVVGLPRGLDGQETQQTRIAETFADELQDRLHISVHLQDEALTSIEAEKILRAGGKPYDKGDIDSLAASMILADFLEATEKTV